MVQRHVIEVVCPSDWCRPLPRVFAATAPAPLQDLRRLGCPARPACFGCLSAGLGRRAGRGSLALVDTRSRLKGLLIGHAVQTASQPFSSLGRVAFEAGPVTQCFESVVRFGRVLLTALVFPGGFSQHRDCLGCFPPSRGAFPCGWLLTQGPSTSSVPTGRLPRLPVSVRFFRFSAATPTGNIDGRVGPGLMKPVRLGVRGGWRRGCWRWPSVAPCPAVEVHRGRKAGRRWRWKKWR